MKLKILAIIFAICILFTMPTYATSSTVECPPDLPGREIICGDGGEAELMQVIGNVLNVVYGMVGILSVVMIVIGGVKYMTCQGEPERIQSAKNTILYAIIGLVITLSAFAITAFILSALTS